MGLVSWQRMHVFMRDKRVTRVFSEASTILLHEFQVMLVAVHPWDCNGAKAAGLKTAFIARKGEEFPGIFRAPDYHASSLEDLAEQLRTR